MGFKVKNKKAVKILLFFTPVMYFFLNRILQAILGNEIQESLMSEVIWAIIIGAGMSYGFWYSFLKKKAK